MNHLLFYDNFLNEYYDNFYGKIKSYYGSKERVHELSPKYFTNIDKLLTPEDNKIIDWYTDCGYRHIIEYMITKKPSFAEDKDFDWDKTSVENKILKFEEIINKSVVKKDVVVWKGLNNYPVRSNNLKNIIFKMNIGDNYKFQNFFSTSLCFQYAVFAFGFDDDSLILKINVPAGSKAMYISKTENEVVLQRNQTIKLKDIYEYDLGKHYKRHQGKILKIYEFDLI